MPGTPGAIWDGMTNATNTANYFDSIIKHAANVCAKGATSCPNCAAAFDALENRDDVADATKHLMAALGGRRREEARAAIELLAMIA